MRKEKTGCWPGTILVAVLASALQPFAVTLVAAADAAHGKAVFQNCAACHSDKPDAIGPSLRGVYGRKSAALTDFHYSNAMMRAGLTWDDANLRDYLKDPQAKIKGNRMPFGGISDPKDIDDLIAYLRDYK
jgi:cytochrome c